MALRALDDVEAVTADETGELLLVQTGPTAARSLHRAVLEIVKERLDHTVVVQLVGTGDAAGHEAVPDAADSSAPEAPLEVVAVHTEPPTGELEVYLRGGEVRTVGRTTSRELVGATTATLEEWPARPGAPRRAVGWARAVETSGTGALRGGGRARRFPPGDRRARHRLGPRPLRPQWRPRSTR